MEDLLSRIQRLEAQLEAKQTPNQTQTALSSLQEQQESFEATLTSQFMNDCAEFSTEYEFSAG